MAEKKYGFTESNLKYAQLIYACMQDDWWVDHITTPEGLQVTARMYGSVLYDIKGLRSGYISVNALKAVLAGEVTVTQLSDEHYHARQTSGRDIIRFFTEHRNCSFEEFALYLQRLCSVHKVLRTENQDLKKFQNNGEDLHWIEEYKLAGVELIRVELERGKNWTKQSLAKHANDEPTPLEVAAKELATLYGN